MGEKEGVEGGGEDGKEGGSGWERRREWRMGERMGEREGVEDVGEGGSGGCGRGKKEIGVNPSSRHVYTYMQCTFRSLCVMPLS